MIFEILKRLLLAFLHTSAQRKYVSVCDYLMGLKNLTAAGCGAISAGLQQYSNDTGVHVLINPFIAVPAFLCVHSAWCQGISVHVSRDGDAGDYSNYSPLTLLPVIAKLGAELLSQRNFTCHLSPRPVICVPHW